MQLSDVFLAEFELLDELRQGGQLLLLYEFEFVDEINEVFEAGI